MTQVAMERGKGNQKAKDGAHFLVTSKGNQGNREGVQKRGRECGTERTEHSKINCHCDLNQLLYKLAENSPLPFQGLFHSIEKQNKRLGRRIRAQFISKSHLWA